MCTITSAPCRMAPPVWTIGLDHRVQQDDWRCENVNATDRPLTKWVRSLRLHSVRFDNLPICPHPPTKRTGRYRRFQPLPNQYQHSLAEARRLHGRRLPPTPRKPSTLPLTSTNSINFPHVSGSPTRGATLQRLPPAVRDHNLPYGGAAAAATAAAVGVGVIGSSRERERDPLRRRLHEYNHYATATYEYRDREREQFERERTLELEQELERDLERER